MSVHKTASEIAVELNMTRGNVLAACMRLGVPIYQGRIDSELFREAFEKDLRENPPYRAPDAP